MTIPSVNKYHYIVFKPNAEEYIVKSRPYAANLPVDTYYCRIYTNEWYKTVRLGTNLYTAILLTCPEEMVPKEFLLKKLLLS